MNSLALFNTARPGTAGSVGIGMSAFTMLSRLLFFVLLGIFAKTVAWVSCFLAFNAVFSRANIRIARWIRYFIQLLAAHVIRPTHEIHSWNRANLPPQDIAADTSCNLRHADDPRTGFNDEVTARPITLCSAVTSVPSRWRHCVVASPPTQARAFPIDECKYLV